MLTNLDFLKNGQIFPPLGECERIVDYNDNLKLFHGNYYNLNKTHFNDMLKCIQQNILFNGYVTSIQKLIDNNYFYLTSIKTRDLVCGDSIDISVEKYEQTQQLLQEVKLHHKLDQLVIDLSRYGDAVVLTYLTNENKANISVIPPECLFKIVDPSDKDNILQYVIAKVVEIDLNDNKKKYLLDVQIHEKGIYTAQTYELAEPMNNSLQLKNGASEGRNIHLRRYKINKKLSEDKFSTGLTNFAVVSMHQGITSDNCFGKSDYDVFDSIICEINQRLSEISMILHKHSDPMLYAPQSAFTFDPISGQWVLKTRGSCFMGDESSFSPQYITWDGQLLANFQFLDKLYNQLNTLSQMGAVFSVSDGNEQIAFDTMNAKFVNAKAKANRIQLAIIEPLKYLIQNIFELNHINIEHQDININFKDFLPRDEAREIQNAVAKIEGGLSTPTRENVLRFGMSEEDAEQLAEEVAEEESRKASYMSLSPNNLNEDEDKEDDENEEQDNK